MPRLPRPAVLLAIALALTAALVLTACSGARPADMPAVGTAPQAILAYQVQQGAQTYPFVVSMRQNSADGIAFGFDLGDGAQTGAVMMSADAMQSATAMQNTFGAPLYQLTDKTSAWLARGPFATLRDGGSVALNLGSGPSTFSGDCGETFTVGTAGGASYAVPACRFTAGEQSLVIADDPAQPLILSMDAGTFSVSLKTAAPR